jgi:ABC-type multidrug transport system fused ATPase/permease subunit
MDSDYFLHLTDVGREVAEQIYEKHRRIAESGTHEKFLAKGGKYAAMWNTEQKISA